MLLELEIKNFILIEHHKISFKNGFSSLTGETGAGKSIILDALNLIKGSRIESKYQKNKNFKTEILADFDIQFNDKANLFLKENDFINEENPFSLNVRRVILVNGKSNSYINDIKCSLQNLKTLGELLIEIHSQNSSRNLIIPEKQQEILDIYCNHNQDLASLTLLSKEYNLLNTSILDYKNKKEDHQSKIELIQYKISEIQELNLLEGEYEELSENYKILSNADKIAEACDSSISILNDISSKFSILQKKLNILFDNKNVKEIKQMANEVFVNLDEITRSLEVEKDNNNSDDYLLESIEQRINKINVLSKKHFIDPENFHDFYLNLESQLNEFKSYDEKIEDLMQQKDFIEKKWFSIAEKISINRKRNAINLSLDIKEKINALKMKNADFRIVFNDVNEPQVNKNGIDDLVFEISTNLGSEFELLKTAASGGEISRISLAIQSIISKNYNIPIQIFDEIDVGIGGTTGNSVGLFLHEISKYSQVISITHLPQVASFADHNFFIHKKEADGKTVTYIELLNEDNKLEEFSRMLGYETFSQENKNMVFKIIENSNKMKNKEEILDKKGVE